MVIPPQGPLKSYTVPSGEVTKVITVPVGETYPFMQLSGLKQ